MQDKAKEIGELDSEYKARQDALEKQHMEEVKELKKKIDVTEANLNMVKMKNKTDEIKLRDEYRKNDRLYGENINAYDIEMRDKMRQKESMNQEFEQVHT
jgi:Iap family predicted aminopeptidase